MVAGIEKQLLVFAVKESVKHEEAAAVEEDEGEVAVEE